MSAVETCSQTYTNMSPLGQRKSDLLIQVTAYVGFIVFKLSITTM